MMSSHRTERLLNLVICLLATHRWLAKDQIRSAVPQYADCGSTDAFDRMFERDKEDLRELGIPLVTGTGDSAFGDEPGYRIDRDSYGLPDIELTAAEAAVLGLASRVWQQASLAAPAARAMVKLKALGVQPDEGSLIGVEPKIRTTEPSFDPLYAATRDHAPVAFRYRKPTGDVAERHIEPWAVVNRGRWWYVVGRDRDRGAARVFRLSRIEGTVRRIGEPGSFQVPAGIDPLAAVQAPIPEDERQARMRVRRGRAGTLRLRALSPPVEVDPPWEELTVLVGDVEALAQEITGYGPDVLVTEPQDLRDAVIRRLRRTVRAHNEDAGATR